MRQIRKNKRGNIHVLIQDDTEILGNGQGHVMYRVYLPVLKYIELLKRYGLKSTFYFEIGHLLFLKANSEVKDFQLQAELIEKTILHVLENGMEVQLHIHSQWGNAKYVNNYIRVTNKWNIGQLKVEKQKDLFRNSLACIKSIVDKSKNTNLLNSFKAGAWALQPIHNLYDELSSEGLTLILGPFNGLKIKSINLDYANMESSFYPYYCDKNDINKIGSLKDIVIVPMSPTYLNWFDLIRYFNSVKFNGFVKRFDSDLDHDPNTLPSEIKVLKPLAEMNKLNFSLKPFRTYLKMNGQPFWYLKNTFKRTYKYILKEVYDYKLIILETHTKDFKNNFNNIDRFFKYLRDNYSNLTFITTSELVEHINDGKLKPLLKQ